MNEMTTTDQLLLQDIDQPEIKQVKSFNQRLRELFLPGTKKFSEQEEVLINIIYKLLASPDTLKFTPHTGAYYLANDKLHYYVRVGFGNVTLVNTVDSVVRDTTANFTDFVRNIIDKEVEKDTQTLDRVIFGRDLHILKKVEERVDGALSVQESGEE